MIVLQSALNEAMIEVLYYALMVTETQPSLRCYPVVVAKMLAFPVTS